MLYLNINENICVYLVVLLRILLIWSVSVLYAWWLGCKLLLRKFLQLDDALSATRLQDGRIKVWIHVADPTRLVQPGSIIDKYIRFHVNIIFQSWISEEVCNWVLDFREAMKRGTSIFLPTATYPMFPEKLAMEGMSLKQGELNKALTVSVVLHGDGG